MDLAKRGGPCGGSGSRGRSLRVAARRANRRERSECDEACARYMEHAVSLPEPLARVTQRRARRRDAPRSPIKGFSGNANLPIGGQRNAIQENGVPRSLQSSQCVTVRKYSTVTPAKLFNGDGFGEVAGLIDVAAAAYRDVIGQKLQGNDLQQWREKFRRGRHLEDVIGRC